MPKVSSDLSMHRHHTHTSSSLPFSPTRYAPHRSFRISVQVSAVVRVEDQPELTRGRKLLPQTMEDLGRLLIFSKERSKSSQLIGRWTGGGGVSLWQKCCLPFREVCRGSVLTLTLTQSGVGLTPKREEPLPCGWLAVLSVNSGRGPSTLPCQSGSQLAKQNKQVIFSVSLSPQITVG